jgi:DNA-binding CsgD family transcriptional regulator
MQHSLRFASGARDAGGQAVAGLAFLTVAVIFLGELSTPRDISVASLAVVPVATAGWYTELAYRPLLLFTIALAMLVAVAGSLSPQSAAAACVSCIAMTALVRAARRSARANQARGAAGEPIMPIAPAPIVHRTQAAVPTQYKPLTAREKQVVDLAAAGFTAREIGARLFIGERTVETHLANSYSKLGVSSKRELVQRSHRTVT